MFFLDFDIQSKQYGKQGLSRKHKRLYEIIVNTIPKLYCARNNSDRMKTIQMD